MNGFSSFVFRPVRSIHQISRENFKCSVRDMQSVNVRGVTVQTDGLKECDKGRFVVSACTSFLGGTVVQFVVIVISSSRGTDAEEARARPATSSVSPEASKLTRSLSPQGALGDGSSRDNESTTVEVETNSSSAYLASASESSKESSSVPSDQYRLVITSSRKAGSSSPILLV